MLRCRALRASALRRYDNFAQRRSGAFTHVSSYASLPSTVKPELATALSGERAQVRLLACKCTY